MSLSIESVLRAVPPTAVVQDAPNALVLFQNENIALKFARQLAPAHQKEVTIADCDSAHSFSQGDVLRLRCEFESQQLRVVVKVDVRKPREASSYTASDGMRSCVGFTYCVPIFDVTPAQLQAAAKNLSVPVITKEQATQQFVRKPSHCEVVSIGAPGTKYKPSTQKAALHAAFH